MNKRKLNQTIILVFALMLMLVSTVYANDSVTTTLPISQEIVMTDPDDAPETLTCHYELSTEQEDAPLPQGSEDGEYLFSIRGMDAEVTIPLCFTHAGVYHYTLHQVDKDTEYCLCDHTHYEATVVVQNEPNGGLSAQMIVEDESNDEKCGEIMFRTVYRDIPDETPDEIPSEPSSPDVPHNPDNTTPDNNQGPAAPSDSPQTGDTSSIVLWTLMAAGSFSVLILLTILKKAQNRA